MVTECTEEIYWRNKLGNPSDRRELVKVGEGSGGTRAVSPGRKGEGATHD